MNVTAPNFIARALMAAGLSIVLSAAAVNAQQLQDQSLNSTSDPAVDPAAAPATTASSADAAAPQVPVAPIPPAPNPQVKPAYWAANLGYTGDSQNTGYGYAGPGYVHPISRYVAWVADANVNYLFYSYNNGVGGKTTVHSPGLNTDVGLRLGDTNWVQFALGPGFKDRSVEENNGAGIPMSSTHGMVAEMNYNAMAYVNPWKTSNAMGINHYGSGDKYRWSMAQFKQQVANFHWRGPFTPSIGIQGIDEGNDVVRSQSIGALIEVVHVKSNMSITGVVGRKHTWSPDGIGAAQNGTYFGIGIWKRM